MTAFVPLNATRAKRLLGEAGVDGLIAASLENVYYFTGLWSENFEILPKQTQLFAILSATELADPRLVAVLGEAANIHDQIGPGARPYLYGTFFRHVSKSNALNETERFVKENVLDRAAHATVVDASVAAVHDAGLARARIAYDERGIFPETLEALRSRLPDATLVPGWVLFRQIRSVKTPAEQERLARAVSVAETAMHAAMQVAAVGATEADLIAAYEKSVIDSGARPNFAQIAFGRRGGTGYVMRRDAVLEIGDIIRFDVGAAVDGYQSDIARNFALEEPDARTRRIHEAMVAGQQAAAESLRPGMTASQIFEIGMRAARDAGVPDYQRHHIGHGLGLEVYDIPVLTPSDATELEEGMVISVETPYYELGFGGLQPEDAFVVTPTGGRWLNSLSRAFEVWSGPASVPSR
jgi:Xaa-Pro aminopeptidase